MMSLVLSRGEMPTRKTHLPDAGSEYSKRTILGGGGGGRGEVAAAVMAVVVEVEVEV